MTWVWALGLRLGFGLGLGLETWFSLGLGARSPALSLGGLGLDPTLIELWA